MTTTTERFQVVQYQPRTTEMLKEVVRLGKTDILFSAVQIIGEGGENNLHSHNAMDGLWFVLEGRARFYTTNNEVVAELGKYEGIVVPRETPYWFERIGGEQLQILQVEALLPNVKAVRTDYEPLKDSGKPYLNAESGTIGNPQDR
jgi:mannose-6-phosphate isomerase-like protein (cupin superfamily)